MRPLQLATLLLLAACGVQAPDTDAGVDSGTSTPDASTCCSSPLWPVGATHAHVEEHHYAPSFTCPTDGGLVLGSTFDLSLADAGLSWLVCRGYLTKTIYEGSISLTPAQLASFDTAMAGLVRMQPEPLLGDHPTRVIVLTVDGGTLRYKDTGHPSSWPDTSFVQPDGMRDVISVLYELASIPYP